MVSKDDYKILCGDAVDMLKTLPDKSVQCCITSPPYYGLRDYGTGHWEGGDPDCPHYRTSKYSEHDCTGHKAMGEQGQAVGDAIYKTICPLCGAVRVDKQIGLEETPEEYIARLVSVFREVKRVLKDNGTLWVNIGDSYVSTNPTNRNFIDDGGRGGNNEKICKHEVSSVYKQKDLYGIPWQLAFALRADGWVLRQDIIWNRCNPMPESVKDRCTKSHEYIFLLAKQPTYLFNYEAIQEEATGYDGRKDTLLKGSPKYADAQIMPNGSVQSMAKEGHERWKFKNLQYDGQTTHTMHERRAQGLPDEVYTKMCGDIMIPIRNKRDVWNVPVSGFKGAHFATYPVELILPCVLAGSNEGDTVLDPFNGAGTTGIACMQNGRKYIGCELNPEYVKLTEDRYNEIFFGKKKIEESTEPSGEFSKFDWGV